VPAVRTRDASDDLDDKSTTTTTRIEPDAGFSMPRKTVIKKSKTKTQAPAGIQRQRSADPYRDLDVIDSRAPRTNQATIGALALLAFATGWWPLLAILAAQLFVGLRFGRRYCLPCLAYFEVIQPRFGEGPIEDSRPPRFANQIGFVVLTAASLAHLGGLEVLGWVLGLMVAALALLAAVTGFCAGCELYKLGARIRGIRGDALQWIDRADLGVKGDEPVTVLFTHPLCTDCHEMERDLRDSEVSLVGIDVRERPDLARRYQISVVPTAVSVGPDGRATLLAPAL
jgi:hypothetical protein